VEVPSDSVIQKPGEQANTIELQPGEEVVGQGEPVGTVYKLSDGRTVIVRPDSAAPVPGEDAPSTGGSSGSDPTTPTPTPGTTPSPDGSSGGSSSGGSSAPSDSLTAPQPSTGAP
jgi:hypothetical protein